VAELHVERRGSGQPLVLVHGWGAAGAATWRHQLEGLSAELCVLAPDLPGFGRSPAPAVADAPTFAAAVAEVVASTGRDDVVLAGWSMGGLVVLEYAERFGCGRLAGLVIVDVAPRGRPTEDWHRGNEPGDGFSARVDEWAAEWHEHRAEVVREVTTMAFVDPERHRNDIELLIADALRADPGAALGAFLDLLDRDYRDALRTIDVPMLLVFGEMSTSTTPVVRSFMEQTSPRAESLVFGGCGHALVLEEPERFNAALGAFARSHARSAE
jgi:pimeloyl-ACP methyl ester carboxylesterase